MAPPDASAIRVLAERLIAIASVSPDVAGETRCARALIDALPPGIEHGTWPTPDGRPVVWAFVRGRSLRTLVMLGHYDTVGFDEFASLGAPGGSAIALDPRALREWITTHGTDHEHGETLERDVEEEWRRPGTWLFGRGALDMKSGLAAGVGALAALAETEDTLPGSVLFVATPDEENQSEGMKIAAARMLDFQFERAIDCVGVLNLDYTDAAVAYRGALGKSRIGMWVLGVAAHAGRPFEAVDATQIAAEIVLRATLWPTLAERWNDVAGPPPVALRMRDLKPRYDVQTAAEATVELNVLTFARSPDEILERVRAVALGAVVDVLKRRDALRGEFSSASAPARAWGAPTVMTLAEFEERVPWNVDEVLRVLTAPAGLAAESASGVIRRLRSLAGRARVSGPAIVLYELPPHYPSVAPREGPLSRAAAEVLAREGVEIRPFYPFVTDASLLAGPLAPGFNVLSKPAAPAAPAAPASTLAAPAAPAAPASTPAGEPANVRSSAPAAQSASARKPICPGPDIVTLGPWGRGAHGLFERVNAAWAFEKLPRLIGAVTRAALKD